MLDSNGFRVNVGMVICNAQGRVLLCKRRKENAWQFPQGGVDDNETTTEAMYRELEEELGLTSKMVKILKVTKDWLYYRLPNRLLRSKKTNPFVGQKQKWFLLLLTVSDEVLAERFATCLHPEFDDWKWVAYWYPVDQIIFFKRAVYIKMLYELLPALPHPSKDIL